MRIADSNLADLIEDIHVSEYGNYYFFDDFIISEINEGVLYNWAAAQDAIEAAYKHYGENPSICYITNRVNNYSVKPLDWIKFFSSKNKLNGYAIVSYTERGWVNAVVEKLFLKTRVERFFDLYDAISWAKKVNSSIKNTEENNAANKEK
ncbi:hypothetical protein [uncultured Lacinutrix sp.]|uniref:hypothetical protein n=1 Tax=uncultured Lacinutrix sp. TaxID=574032 RepID=UPI002608489C|nr:hypothetical protein [uncultured Lacinutrix sp.]